MKRVAIAEFLHESNTYLPVPTTYSDFAQTSLTKGEDLIRRWQGGHHELSGFLEGALLYGFDAVPVMATYAMPSGTIESSAFEQIAREMIDALRAAMPVDG